MTKLTKEVYERIEAAIFELSEGGGPCANLKTGTCMYRKTKGSPENMNNACIVGKLMPDDLFVSGGGIIPDQEVIVVTGLSEKFLGMEEEIEGIPVSVLSSLQKCHDDFANQVWYVYLKDKDPIVFKEHWDKLYRFFLSNYYYEDEKKGETV